MGNGHWAMGRSVGRKAQGRLPGPTSGRPRESLGACHEPQAGSAAIGAPNRDKAAEPWHPTTATARGRAAPARPSPAQVRLRSAPARPSPAKTRLRSAPARPSPLKTGLRATPQRLSPVEVRLLTTPARPSPATTHLRAGLERLFQNETHVRARLHPLLEAVQSPSARAGLTLVGPDQELAAGSESGRLAPARTSRTRSSRPV